MTAPREPRYFASREQLVEFVREVIGEHVKATAEPRYIAVRVNDGMKSLQLRFLLAGHREIAVYLLPLPLQVRAVMGTHENPWNSLVCEVSAVDADPLMGALHTLSHGDVGHYVDPDAEPDHSIPAGDDEGADQ